jgi:hypothetical protein
LQGLDEVALAKSTIAALGSYNMMFKGESTLRAR